MQFNCWVWPKGLNRGYGRIHKDGKHQYIHRMIYEFLVAKIPSNMTLDHLCRNTKCVNPFHLEAVTLAENIMRGEGICARNARKTHCKRGHPFNKENTYVTEGRRTCWQCRLDKHREYLDKKAGRKRIPRNRIIKAGIEATS